MSAITLRYEPEVMAARDFETAGSSTGATRTVTFCWPRTVLRAVPTILRIRVSSSSSPMIFLTDWLTTLTTVLSMFSMNSTEASTVSIIFSACSILPASRPSA